MDGLVLGFPTNVELDMVTQEYVVQRDQLIGGSILPFQNVMTQRVQWDELDIEHGMTPPHSMDADPQVQKRPGSKTREYTPIPFKASEVIKESELLRSRELGTLAGVIRIDDEVARRSKARIDKDFIRAEWLRWNCLQGAIAINENGVKVDETFDVQTHDASDWGTHNTATPLKDFDDVGLKFRGTGASASGAVAYMNRTTANHLLENSNDADIQGFRSQNFLALTFSIEEANRILVGRSLPTMSVYDEGYFDANGDFQLFIPDDKVIVVGKRMPGERIGDFVLTPTLHRQTNGMPAPGFFSFITVNGQTNPGSVVLSQLGSAGNPKIEITTGFYGGPRLIYPKSIVVMDVS